MAEESILLGCDPAPLGNRFETFRDDVLTSSDCVVMQRHVPEERNSQCTHTYLTSYVAIFTQNKS